jgi:hypothetical protein
VPCPDVTAIVSAPDVAPPDCVANRAFDTSSSHEYFVATVFFFSARRENTASGCADGSRSEIRSPRSIAS